MAWNKYGSDLIAIGTTSGYVVVYDVGQSYKNILQLKEHDGIMMINVGNINNIEWNMGSRDNFVSSSFENYVLQWDPKINSEKPVAKY
jgi:WD40 repeat protein